MGVPGLWEILNKAGKSTSIAHLAVVEGFQENASQRHGYRLGIDASLWLNHSHLSKGGENPGIRFLFFRLAFFKKLPIIPLFMFDGAQRPKLKRKSRLGKSGSHQLVPHLKKFITAFGMEWREAPAEAEAELAYLNQQGFIDAILTDDCDAFIFGARKIIKNLSDTLSGNKSNPALNGDEKSDNLHGMLYCLDDFKTHPEISLSRGGMILFALLSGGDYNDGLPNFGKVIAHALSRCEFGDDLLEAATNLQGELLQEFLKYWRVRVNDELRNNTRGFLKHRTNLSIPEDFPDLTILAMYVTPLVSSDGQSMAVRDNGQFDCAKVGQLCEEYFEWGFKQKILERFKNLIWPGAVMHILRRSAIQGRGVGTPAGLVRNQLSGTKASRQEREERISSAFVRQSETRARPTVIPDPYPLISGDILKERRHVSTDNVLEYQISVCPIQLVRQVGPSLKGTRPTPPSKCQPKDPEENFSVWVPAVMLDFVHPGMVQRFRATRDNQPTRRRGKKRPHDLIDDNKNTQEEPLLHSGNVIPAIRANSHRSGFSFTFPDPTCDDCIQNDEDHNRDESTSSPSDRNQIPDAPPKRRKKSAEKEPQHSKRIPKAGSRKGKKAHIFVPKSGSTSILDILDSLDFS